jgi:hypothetical protein
MLFLRSGGEIFVCLPEILERFLLALRQRSEYGVCVGYIDTDCTQNLDLVL